MSKKARVEHDRLVNRVVVIAAIVIVSLVVVLLGWGLVLENLIWPGQPVAVVRGEEISTRYFQARVRYSRSQLVNNYIQTYQSMEYFASISVDLATSLQSSLLQIEADLDPLTVGENTLNSLISELLIRQEAIDRGITVTDQEVDEFLQTQFGFYPEGSPTATITPTTAPTSTFSPTQLALVTLTPTASPSPAFTQTLTPTISSEPTEVLATATITPTATPYTEELYQQNLQDFLVQLKDIHFSEEQLRYMVGSILYSQKLGELVTQDVPWEEEQVWARHILVEDQETANEVYARLQDGEDWTALAAEYSIDTASKDQGGDLGWFNAQDMVTQFAAVAFGYEIGQISTPFETQYGWHIVQVLGHETRPLTPTQHDEKTQTVFNQWLQNLLDETDWEINDYWEDRVPTKPRIPVQILLQ